MIYGRQPKEGKSFPLLPTFCPQTQKAKFGLSITFCIWLLPQWGLRRKERKEGALSDCKFTAVMPSFFPSTLSPLRAATAPVQQEKQIEPGWSDPSRNVQMKRPKGRREDLRLIKESTSSPIFSPSFVPPLHPLFASESLAPIKPESHHKCKYLRRGEEGKS